MKTKMTQVVIAIALSFTAGSARAPNALSELKLQAGADATALAERNIETPVSVAIPELQDQTPPTDVFAKCGDIDALTLRAWSLPEAAQHVQTCLNKTYSPLTLPRKIYWVTAEAARFTVRACPPNAPRTCQGLMLVDGVKITVSGRVPASDGVVSDIEYSLLKRRGMVLGFHAKLENKSQPLP
ncbi:MAG: hypothetical protein ACHQ49_13630 [Elusimicrobiota bacterium]